MRTGGCCGFQQGVFGQYAVGIGLCLAAAMGWPDLVRAVSCPGSGALVAVKVFNPTASPVSNVVLSGSSINGEITCTNQAGSYTDTVTLAPGMNTFYEKTASGLNLVSGMWVHHISAPSGQSQYRKGVVLYASATADYPVVNWTYFPTVKTVNVSGDGNGTCVSNCTFRQAVNTANGLSGSATAPILIQFSTSPGNMTISSDINIGSGTSGHMTIDGTNSSGNPWIVADPFAAAASNQDPFPTVIDLKDIVTLNIQGTHITMTGLDIENTSPGGASTGLLIDDATGNLTLDGVRLSGGATTSSTCGAGCTSGKLLYSTQSGDVLTNVEGLGAYGDGIEFTSGSLNTVNDSWLHNNYGNNIVTAETTLNRNAIELAGYRPDNTSVATSTGIDHPGGGSLTLSRNLIRSNRDYGIDTVAPGGSSVTATGDYVCGNRFGGLRILGGGSASVAIAGYAGAYNHGYQSEIDSSVLSGTLTFSGGSAFTAGPGCGFKNSSSVTATATGNQWRGATGSTCTTSSDYCAGSPIVCTSPVNYQDIAVNLAAAPIVPSNVILAGQTVRVQGTGFNAIDSNPVPGPTPACSDGDGTTSSNCCRNATKGGLNATVCDNSSPPKGQAGKGQCVAFQDHNGTWTKGSVSGVSSQTMLTQVPSTVFACLGESSEVVRVSKIRSDGMTENSAQANYCNQVAPKL